MDDEFLIPPPHSFTVPEGRPILYDAHGTPLEAADWICDADDRDESPITRQHYSAHTQER